MKSICRLVTLLLLSVSPLGATPQTEVCDLAGSVVDDAGRPVAGARIELPENAGNADAVKHALSAESGAFVLRQVEVNNATLRVRISAPGFRARSAKLSVRGPSSQPVAKQVVLPRAASVSGRVLDADGQPLEGLLVELERTDLGLAKAEQASDSAGRFHVPDAAAGPWRVRIRHPERTAGLLMPALAEGGEDDLVLFAFVQSEEQCSATIRIQDVHGQPVTNAKPVLSLAARLGLPRPPNLDHPGYVTRLLEPGVFEFRGSCGDWILSWRESTPGMDNRQRILRLTPDSNAEEIVVTLLPGNETRTELHFEDEYGEPLLATIFLRARSALGDGLPRYPFSGIAHVSNGVMQKDLPRGPVRLEVGGIGPSCTREVEIIEGRPAPVLTLPEGPGLYLYPSSAPLYTEGLLRLWRPGHKHAPTWIMLTITRDRWPRLVLEPGPWEFRVECHTSLSSVDQRLPASPVESSFTLEPGGQDVYLEVPVPRPAQLD